MTVARPQLQARRAAPACDASAERAWSCGSSSRRDAWWTSIYTATPVSVAATAAGAPCPGRASPVGAGAEAGEHLGLRCPCGAVPGDLGVFDHDHAAALGGQGRFEVLDTHCSAGAKVSMLDHDRGHGRVPEQSEELGAMTAQSGTNLGHHLRRGQSPAGRLHGEPGDLAVQVGPLIPRGHPGADGHTRGGLGRLIYQDRPRRHLAGWYRQHASVEPAGRALAAHPCTLADSDSFTGPIMTRGCDSPRGCDSHRRTRQSHPFRSTVGNPCQRPGKGGTSTVRRFVPVCGTVFGRGRQGHDHGRRLSRYLFAR